MHIKKEDKYERSKWIEASNDDGDYDGGGGGGTHRSVLTTAIVLAKRMKVCAAHYA